MPFVQNNAITLHYAHVEGCGPPLVFINSLGTDFRIWDGVIARLGGGMSTVRYDKRGHGLSGIGHAPMTMDDHVADLTGLLDMLGVSGAVLCGLSVGGMIAQGVATCRPDLVSALVLMDTGHRIGTAELWNGRIAAVEARGIESISDGILERWFSAGWRRDDNPDFAGYRAMLERTPAVGYVRTCAAIRDTDYTEAASAIDVPTLCLVGAEDGATPPALVAELASLIPGARFEVIDSAGHLPCIEAPDRVTALLKTFLAGLQPAGRTGAGMATRRAVLGDAHVDRAEGEKTAFDAAFQSLITEGAWGTVWSGAGISRRERSMLTLALLAATGNMDEIPMHIRATARTGASETDVTEAFQHVAVYAGVPRANRAIKIAKATYAAMRGDSDD